MQYVDPNYEAHVWTMSILKNDTNVTALVNQRIYNDGNVPDDAIYPFIVLGDQAETTKLTGVGAHLIWDDILLLVKSTFDQMDSSMLAPITATVREKLHKKRGVTANARILSCIIESPFRLVEEFQGEFQFLHQGTIFRYKIQPIGD